MTATKGRRHKNDMGRLFRLILILIVLGVIGLVAYAYSGYLQPDQHSVTQPVDLDVD